MERSENDETEFAVHSSEESNYYNLNIDFISSANILNVFEINESDHGITMPKLKSKKSTRVYPINWLHIFNLLLNSFLSPEKRKLSSYTPIYESIYKITRGSATWNYVRSVNN